MYHAHMILRVELGLEIYHTYARPLVEKGNEPHVVFVWCKKHCIRQLPFMFLFSIPEYAVVSPENEPVSSDSNAQIQPLLPF